MNQKALYSLMGLAALPLGANADVVQVQAAQLNNWEGTGLTVADGTISSDGSKAEYTISQLLPGKYKLTCTLTTKVYDVDVEIAGVKVTKKGTNGEATKQKVEIEFTLTETKDVTLSFTSSDPGVSGAAYSFSAPVLDLEFDFGGAKETLKTRANALKTVDIVKYTYDSTKDVEAVDNLVKDINAIEEKYLTYKEKKLYNLDSKKTTFDDKIAEIAAAIAAHQNEQAYNDVNADITAIKAKYNTAVAELEETLVGAAAYLLDGANGAKADLNDNINLKITEATSASYASYQAGTAVADETTNTDKIPTEAELNTIVNNWKGQATTNIDAYNALHAQVTTLQNALNNVKPASGDIASLFPKTEAQAAIDAINTKVENAYNSAAQLTLKVKDDVDAAQKKIAELEGKVNKANAEYNANAATATAIAGVQKKLDDAKAFVNAKVSTDGKYKAQDYYTDYVKGIQDKITKLTTDAAAAYKVDGTGTAQTYNSELAAKITAIEGEITPYQTNAVKAVEKYDELVAAMASYQKDLDEVRGLVENLAIYEAEGYDYKTQLDLLQKRINDIKKAIDAAKEKVGAEHWTAMNAIDKDEAITTDIKALKDGYQTAENTYDRITLDTSLTGLADQITTFNTNATETILGADYTDFVAAEAAINAKVTAAQTEREAIDPADEKAPEKIVALGEKVDQIKADQKALEDAAAAVKAKVVANNSAKTGLATSINALQTKIGTFKDTYKIGTDASTLGNRGKAEGSVTKEVGDIETALSALEGKNDVVVTTVVSKVEKGVATNGLANGLYEVEVEVDAKAAGTLTVNFTETAYAAGKATPTVKAFVYDGTLKAAVSGKDDKVTIKKLTYHENSLDATYNNADEKNPGYNNTYSALNAQENALETAALGIKTAVENNAATYTAATKDVTDLQAAELNTLKSLKNVTNDAAVSDDATAKKADPADFKVFETGLAADKSYTAKKTAIDADITALQAALDASKAAETMVEKWQNKSITVGEGDAAKTYSISAITNAINNLKAEAVAESDNYEAYKALQDNNMPKLRPDTIFTKKDGENLVDMTEAEIKEIIGGGAYDYYIRLQKSYKEGKANILTAMQQSLSARTAVSTKSGFVSQIAALIEKVKVVKSDGIANKKRYDEQKTAYTETQTLWNSTYTEIAATDHSSQVQKWLDDLDAIQVDLTAATETVETSYPKGESVAKTQDFASIKARINDVKAQQSEAYNAQIAADNQAAHESFIQAIASATAAYQTAVVERAKYSSTNADIEAAVTEAAATLDAALYSCPTDIEKLKAEENAAYAAVQSPTVFDVDSYNTSALTIEQNITKELNDFKAAVKKAIDEEVWSPKKTEYNSKVAAAENAIAGYSDAAKKDAFKDVKEQIAKGDAGVNEWTLTKVEEAIETLKNIDNMLKADKDRAADKDITALLQTVEEKYGEVKTYIESVTNDIPAKATQLNRLNEAYDDGVAFDENNYEDVAYAKTLAKNFANHDGIAAVLNGFVATADDCKTTVENAVAADNANTEAYQEMADAITPVAEKLEEAKAEAAPYKYATSFGTNESALQGIQEDVESYKRKGSAVANKDALLARVENLSSDIETTLTIAFSTEKTGLVADITELKNQYNAYVAKNGLNETATAFKAKIDDLETQLSNIAIKDLDKTKEKPEGDGIQFDEIVAATRNLIKLQNDIADFETELLKANANAANADVLADFQSQLSALEETASLDGYDEWVGQQTLGDKTLQEQITALQQQIAELRAAIEAEPNIAFYKKNYQDELDAIKKALDPVAKKIQELDAKFKANAAAYATLSRQIEELQGKIDAAKQKVGAYQYASNYYIDYIEEYDWNDPSLLVGGAQYDLNNAKTAIDNDNSSKSLTSSSVVPNKAGIENSIQNYLDLSAHNELSNQANALSNSLANAIDKKYLSQTYSNALWARLQVDKTNINYEIVALWKQIYSSDQTYAGSFDNPQTSWSQSYIIKGSRYDYYFTLDENNNLISRTKTSDADYESQMETVAAIQAKINDLSNAVDNLQLLGDANEDGRVNVLDYQKVLNMILDPTLQPSIDVDESIVAKHQTDDELFRNIDINASDVIEVGDLTAIVNYILYQNWQGYAAVKGFGAAGESLTMDITPVQQGVQRYAINLQNTEDYTAFQLDVVLPEGMKIVGQSLSDRAGQSHKLYSRAQQDGSIRLLASSIKGESFSGSEGAVLYIDVETTSDFKGGSVEMMNILFSDVYAQTRAFAIGNGGEATGIDITAAMQTLKQKVYDLGGRMMNGLKKGVNIIQGADGQTKKVVK